MLMNWRMHEKEHSLVLQSDGTHKAIDLKFPTENQMFEHFTNQRRSFINFKTVLRIHCCFWCIFIVKFYFSLLTFHQIFKVEENVGKAMYRLTNT